jgi:uncharacterized Rossmann fold enzyme
LEGKNVRWRVWRPWYTKIVERLGLDPEADLEAARVLDGILPKPYISQLKKLVHDKDCVVLGAGPSLEDDLKKLESKGWMDKSFISADGATSALLRYRPPDIVVTDLDGNVHDQLEAWERGSWLVLHAHGDNLDKIRRIAPQIDVCVLGTTQVESFGKLFNFGGFTDGDRAAFMAHELGASRIYLVGMDLGSEIGKYSGDKDLKRKTVKLSICKELLAWLAGDLGAKLINLTAKGETIPKVPREDP